MTSRDSRDALADRVQSILVSHMRFLTRALLLSLGLAASVSCGRGGAAPVDGGTPDADAAGPNLPGCLRDLFALCPETGECRTMRGDAGDDGISYVSCFDSGVRSEDTVTYGRTGPPLCTGHAERKVFKPDGQLCYAYETKDVMVNPYCESQTATWRDAMGQLIASAWLGTGTRTVTCTAGGETLECGSMCPRIFPSSCPTGTCP
jgi:hypothetical protein